MKILPFACLVVATNLCASEVSNEKATPVDRVPYGWSFDVGGQYTWMSFQRPPHYQGNTGGCVGKVSYQNPWSFFGELRTVYNMGKLPSNVNSSNIKEWYTEFVAGYSLSFVQRLSITPYVGIGADFFKDHHSAYGVVAPIKLNYHTYYGVFGFNIRYFWDDWLLGVQADCLPVFSQYLRINALPGKAWTLQQKIGADVHLPVGYRVFKNLWVELDPYYRFFPFGSSNVLYLPQRDLDEWGGFLTLRFFL